MFLTLSPPQIASIVPVAAALLDTDDEEKMLLDALWTLDSILYEIGVSFPVTRCLAPYPGGDVARLSLTGYSGACNSNLEDALSCVLLVVIDVFLFAAEPFDLHSCEVAHSGVHFVIVLNVKQDCNKFRPYWTPAAFHDWYPVLSSLVLFCCLKLCLYVCGVCLVASVCAIRGSVLRRN